MQVKHFPRSKIACLDFRSGFVLRLSTFKPNSFADFYIRKAGVSEELLIVNSLRTASFVSRERFFLHIMGTDFVSCPKPFLGEIIDFSRLVTDRVTVNGNREPCGAWFFPDSGMQRDPLSD